jgi:ribosomal protein S18 acetylase RimI-like enzyme
MRDETIAIRPAREQDRLGVLALAPRLAAGVAPWRNRTAAAAAGGNWLEESLAAAGRGEGIVFVAVAAGEVAGVISARPARHFTGDRDGYIGELAVDETAARRGIGRALVEAARAWAQDQGLANLTLHTGAFNTNARAFYAALGFHEEEVRLTLKVLEVASHGRHR